MKSRVGVGALACLAAFVGASGPAAAQVANLGSRAQGMAGAFVAVADDPSAVYWNPAGLGGALVVGAVFDLSRQDAHPKGTPAQAPGSAEAFRQEGQILAVALPPVGLSYYRLRYAGVQVGTAEPDPDGRQVEGRDVSFRSLETRQFGLTLVHSLTEAVVVGTTLKIVTGAVGFGEGVRTGDWPELADEALALDRDGETTVDLDAGLMVSTGRVRLGLVVHNLREPAFAAPDGTVALSRRVRAGVAYGSRWPGQSGVVVALDADVTRAATFGEERRDVAAGVEGWGFNRRVSLRSGVRASTVGETRPEASVGLSLGLTPAMFVDAHVSRGRAGQGSWSVGGRVSY